MSQFANIGRSVVTVQDIFDAPVTWTVSLVPLLLALPRPARFWVTSVATVTTIWIVSHQMAPLVPHATPKGAGSSCGHSFCGEAGSTRTQVNHSAANICLVVGIWIPQHAGRRGRYINGGSGGLKTSSSMQLRKRCYLGALYLLSKWVTWDWQNMGRPKLFSLQDTLPPLPVPKLRCTFEGFLESVRPLLSDDEYEKSSQMVSDFASAGGHGERLQRALVEMASRLEGKQSYIEKWWEQDFLRRRDSLPIGGNWYGLDRLDTPRATQSERASRLITAALRFHRLIKKERLEPLCMMGVVPLCMWQYRRLFHTCRQPGREQDTIFTATDYADTRHLCVMCKEELYSFDVFHSDGTPLCAQEIKTQIEAILRMSKGREMAGVSKQPSVGVLTTEHRTTWAQCRQELICAGGGNAESIRRVESSMFLLVLEGPSPQTLTEKANVSFMGNGHNRWFDKSIQLIVFEDGVASVNCERSWADSPVAAHLFGFMHDYESMKMGDGVVSGYWGGGIESIKRKVGVGVGRSGRVVTGGDGVYGLDPPSRLEWKLTSKLAKSIDEAGDKFKKAMAATDLSVMDMRYFGKGFIKKCQVSPDAFVQMALQLAYYRLHSSLPMIVESAHTRQFNHGRTETVRIVTSDSVAFVKAMAHLDQSSAETKLHLLRRACVSHVELLKKAMNGFGIERHLLGLRAMAQELSLQTEALDAPAFHMKWGMSADSCPVQRGPSGGFGGHCDGGYGVSYHINEENIYFHVCHRTGGLTDRKQGISDAFCVAVEQALLDMSILCTKTAQIAQNNSLETLDWTNM